MCIRDVEKQVPIMVLVYYLSKNIMAFLSSCLPAFAEFLEREPFVPA
jgi:hypothetical protein